VPGSIDNMHSDITSLRLSGFPADFRVLRFLFGMRDHLFHTHMALSGSPKAI